MSCSTSSVVAAGDGYRTPFTAVQWQELEHQALIYKYLVAGLPVPPDLVVPIRRSLEALSARFFHHPTLGYCSFYGKKFDPEPGRCRRTDGKKWRCSKDAYPDSKYCERHMHRGRNRSRKPVESHSQSTSSSSISTVISSHIASGGTTAAAGGTGSLGSFQSGSAGESCYQNLPLYVNSNSENLCFGSNASKLNMDNVAYGINNKEYSGRYIDAPNNFSLGGYNNNTESNTDASWPLMGSSLLKSNTLNPSQLVQMPQAFERQQQQHCLFGSEIGSPKRVKQEGNSMRSFFDEWPKARESWPSDHLDDDVDGRSSDNKTMNAFSSTQLSMSIPMARPSDYSSSRNACSPDDV